MDVRAVTGEVSQAVRELDLVLPRFHPLFEMKSDGSGWSLPGCEWPILWIAHKSNLSIRSDGFRWVFHQLEWNG